MKVNNYLSIVFLMCFLMCLSACQKSNPSQKHFQKQWFMMDTIIELTIVDSNQKKSEKNFKEVYIELKRLEKLFSPYDSTAELYRINQSNGKRVIIDKEVFSIINSANAFSDITEGTFDVSIWPLIKLWGFGQKKQSVPRNKDIFNLMPSIGYKQIKLYSEDFSVQFLRPHMGIDLGGVAKGYFLDKISTLLKKNGIQNFLFNAGGNIIVSGKRENEKKWVIGIQHPRESGVIETIEVTDCAVVTSGDYERYFMEDGKRYHHILDPSTGYPADKCIGATIIVNSRTIPNPGIVADILSTAVFVLGHERGMQVIKNFNDTKAIIITPDLKIYKY